MVARLFFPNFAKRHSAGYHAYLAGVVDFGEKASDPAFRMRSTMQHFESFSSQCSGDATQQWTKSLNTGFAMATAMNEGVKAFWCAWFAGIGDTMQNFSKTFEGPKISSSPILDRSADGHVLSVRFKSVAR